MRKSNEKTRFKQRGVGSAKRQPPVSVLLSAEIDQIVRNLPNRSEFLREAIREKLERENLLPKNA